MKKFIFLIFLGFASTVFSQSKYFIYFVDKGLSSSETLEKNSSVYNSTLSLLSEKSIQRRIKNMGEDSFITYDDLRLDSNYVLNIEELGIKIENKVRWFNAVTAYLTEEEKINVANLSFINRIEPVRRFVFKSPDLETPLQYFKQSSVLFDYDYGPSFDQLQLSDVPAVHSKGITGEGILLGLLDTGFNWENHESLKDATVVNEYDFVFKDNSTANDSLDHPNQHNHGTLVFSIVGGLKEGSLIGSSFGSDFILAKTEDIRTEKHIEEDNYAAALEWMESYGVDIISSSLGYSTFNPPDFSYNYSDMDGKTTIVTRATELAFRRGVITITSAGNEGDNSWRYILAPADGTNIIAVGAVNNENLVADFSSRGPTYDGRIKPEVVSQGVGVYCANAGDFSGYITASGTSVAAPIASGIASLLLSAYPHLKNTQVRSIFFESADNNLTPDNERGYGLVSAVKAIEFPNLKASDGTYILNKIYINHENIFPQTVFIYYTTNGIDFTEQLMEYDGNLSYALKLPYFFNDDLVEFYFMYDDNTGATYRDPVSSNYKFYYGSLDISLNLNTKKTYSDYAISDPYPNPFYPALNTFTSILIKSSGNENLTIRIYDPLGQQVGYYSTVTNDNENRFDWYGKNSSGISLSSGVYYLIIDLNGKTFSRNLVLLR
jgi:hypothetical protein